MTVRLVEAGKAHIPPIAASMRQADVREVRAFGKTPTSALQHGLAASLWALTALEDEVPVAMLGVAPKSMLNGIGVPWMLGSERIYDNPRALIRFGPAVIEEMLDTFPRLENLIAVDNTRAIAFLKHWNWEISPDPVKVGGVDFVRFF